MPRRQDAIVGKPLMRTVGVTLAAAASRAFREHSKAVDAEPPKVLMLGICRDVGIERMLQKVRPISLVDGRDRCRTDTLFSEMPSKKMPVQRTQKRQLA